MDSELNLKALILSLRKYIIYIVVISLICTLIPTVYTFTVAPVYSVTAEFISKNIPTDSEKDYNYTDSGLVSAQQNLVNDYVEIIKSDTMLTVVRDIMKDNGYESVSVSKIRSMISASRKDDTSVFTVTVSGTNIKEIKDISSILLKNVSAVINDIQQRDAVKPLSDESEIHVVKVSPKLIPNILTGFAVGFFGSLIIFLVVAYYDRTVRSEDDLKNHFDLPIIGSIPSWNK